MTRVRLTHIKTMTFAFWIAVFGAAFGLFLGVLFGLLAYLNARSAESINYASIVVVTTPVVLFVISLLASLIAAMVYNSFVRHRGGLFFEFEDLGSNADLPPPPPSF